MSESSQTSDTKNCKRCGHNCHCSDSDACCGKKCECKNCNCKDKSLEETIEILSDLTKKKEEKFVSFDPDFNITIH